jgi:hypothetical protein
VSLEDLRSGCSGGPLPWWTLAEPLTKLELRLEERLSFSTKQMAKVLMVILCPSGHLAFD